MTLSIRLTYPVRAGDTVQLDSGEKCVACCDERLGRVALAGWPASVVDVERVTIVERSGYVQRLATLEAASYLGDFRGAWAKAQLEAIDAKKRGSR